MVHELAFGNSQVSYTIHYSDRRTLAIAVNPDCTVIVSAPNNTNLAEVEGKVKKRLRWITKQQEFFRQFTPRATARKYVGGETHFYLGRRYRLKFVSNNVNKVQISGSYILIQSPDINYSHIIESLILQWYRAKAHEKFNEFYNACWERFSNTATGKPRISIRTLSRRWGSLSSAGLLTLNVDLIRSPKECIQYVIIHEFCHLIHKNHTQNFYKLLALNLPDWEKRKKKLEVTLA